MVTISKSLLLVSLLLTILVALQFKDCKSSLPIFDKVHVYVTNNLTNYQLGIDCKDRNYDFGFRTIRFGEFYFFKFRPTLIVGRSLYFCSFSWINGNTHFDIYIQNRDQDCGNECHWVVNESGPCKKQANGESNRSFELCKLSFHPFYES